MTTYEAKHLQYLIKKNSNPARIARVTMNRSAAGKKAAATRKARGYQPSPKQVAQRQRYAAAIAQAKSNGAQPGQILKAARQIMRQEKSGGSVGYKRMRSFIE